MILSRAFGGNAQPDDLTEASKEFALELETDPTNANAAYELGEIQRRAGEFGKAREFFGTAVKYYPDFQEAQVGMGRALISLQKPDEALPHLRKAIELNPEDDVPYYHLAQVYGAFGKRPSSRRRWQNFAACAA